jgi:hypothetical protein
MPALASDFSARARSIAALTQAGEAVRLSARPGSALSGQFTLKTLEALYEAAFIRLFADWEVFLEETFLRMLCGCASTVWVPVLVNARCRTLAEARGRMLGTRSFALWWNPAAITTRARAHLTGSPHELVIGSNLNRLDAFANVRHRLTHRSDQVRQLFDGATLRLAGRRYRAGSVGQFLRDVDMTTAPPHRWLFTIMTELELLALQIAP